MDNNKLEKNKSGKNKKIDKVDKINSKRFPSGFKPRILHKNPYIVKLRRFLNTEEIGEILKMAEGQFEYSTIVIDGEMVFSDTRTSQTAYITENGHQDEYTKPIERIIKRVRYLTGCERNQIESFMVVKYDEGEEYYNHHDYFRPEDAEVMGPEGQRVATFFCYLNSLDKNDGGETEFPDIELTSKPSKGTSIFWWNVDKNNNTIDKTLHHGNPVRNGKVKYGLNIWVREKGW